MVKVLVKVKSDEIPTAKRTRAFLIDLPAHNGAGTTRVIMTKLLRVLWRKSERNGQSMSSHACIYCKSKDGFFNREHVMPQAFGTFEPEFPVLNDCVCAECNNYFGRTLEFALSRDSTEAVRGALMGIF